ncbi:MAG TPA: FIST N-terminal domain-containing protein [Bryobacteraceae bacterium]|nr:FIST N-terminal domain-containing protein [Bryobacteraceae bacterium]
MPVRTAYSTKDLADAVDDLKKQCGAQKPRVVIYFGSAKYDPRELSRRMRQCFPDACLTGCSSAGEIAAGNMMSGSVVAMFLDDDIVEDAACAVVENLSGEISVKDALATLERHFQATLASMDLEKYVGLVMVDGLSGAEERLMEKLGDATDVFFVGGSAGDDLKFQSTHVSADGQSYTNAAILVLLRVKRGFEIVKTQSFQTTGKTLLATKVDEAHRQVIEFNHRPALQAYAERLGVTVAEAPARFFHNPLGLMIAGEPFVRSPQRAEGSAIVFYCQIKEGMELDILEATDIVADTRRAIAAAKAAHSTQGLIDFQCILRTLQLREEKRCEQYGSIFKDIPMIGFSTYGEEYLGHINQTSTILLFR